MNEDLYIAFESYLNDEMPSEEKFEFENHLQNDADIQKKFDIYRETNQFLSAKFDSKTIDFKENLKSISKVHFSETTKKSAKVIAFKPWYYAVSASIVIALGIWFTGSGNPQYSDFSEHESAYFSERAAVDENLNEAQNAFNKKDYKKAVTSFEKVQNRDVPELQYFYAIALIETSDYAKAEHILKDIKSGTSVYKDKATWYLALSYLKQKKLEECQGYLNQIPVDAEDYEKAQKLLKDLE